MKLPIVFTSESKDLHFCIWVAVRNPVEETILKSLCLQISMQLKKIVP